ncbi:MAG: class I SAM-dependent methyltransferase [Rhodobacteraceae bacterium]|nr:class I SAM-dependent methyltransferase [Paracoccaceae bacterium]
MSHLTHAALMDRTYRHQRRIYDLTRAWFLLGRDHLITDLNVPAGGRVLEIACGTGRNLDHIARRYPDCDIYGLDISEQMLESARAKLGMRAALVQGDACAFDAQFSFGVAQFDRIVLSYSLSMIPDWRAALVQAMRHLAPGGSLHIVDFGAQDHLPRFVSVTLNAWLARFHVTPRLELQAELNRMTKNSSMTLDMQHLYRSYAQYAVISSTGPIPAIRPKSGF